jgi:predicted transcriptional regulator
MMKAKLMDALKVIHDERVSSLCIVDEKHRYVGVLSRGYFKVSKFLYL